jgi:hypothetical protein
MAMSSKIVSAVNPDIIDINFGCPVKSCLQRRWCWSFEDVDLMIRLKAVIDSTIYR